MDTLKNRGGDDEQIRLLLFLSSITDEPFSELTQMKKGLWRLSAKNKTYILKQFPSLSLLNVQRLLTERLFENGFPFTYQFHPVHAYKECVFENKVYGIINYLEPASVSPAYADPEFRGRALQLLKNFHKTTSLLANEFSAFLAVFNQQEKWKLRLQDFKKNLPLLNSYIPNAILIEITRWAEWSLEQLDMEDQGLNGMRCIIHGDVAHHNFLFGKNRKLYLIDFDLISISSDVIDDLQFSNRILPYLSWSPERLFSYLPFEKYRYDTAFKKALVFPTDILREWNRFIKSSSAVKQTAWSYLAEITFNQFQQRKVFVKDILQMT